MAFQQQEYLNQYLKDNYWKPTIRVYKEKRDVIEQVARDKNKSINQLFIEAFEKQYRVDLSIPVEKLLRDNK